MEIVALQDIDGEFPVMSTGVGLVVHSLIVVVWELALLVWIIDFNFSDETHEVNFIRNPQKFYILVYLCFIELLKPKSLQKLRPKIRQTYIVIFNVLPNLFSTHFSRQIFSNELKS